MLLVSWGRQRVVFVEPSGFRWSWKRLQAAEHLLTRSISGLVLLSSSSHFSLIKNPAERADLKMLMVSGEEQFSCCSGWHQICKPLCPIPSLAASLAQKAGNSPG